MAGMYRTWDAPRVMRALAALKDSGISVRDMTKMSGANRSTVYRWMSGGDGQPDYALIYNLARNIWRKHPALAKELVEASGYAWAEPTDAPEADVLADEFGAENAARLRRVLGSRGETGALVLRAIEDELRRPGEDAAQGGSERSSAAG